MFEGYLGKACSVSVLTGNGQVKSNIYYKGILESCDEDFLVLKLSKVKVFIAIKYIITVEFDD